MDMKIYCPLTNEKCMKKECGWYVGGVNRCALNSIAQSLYVMAQSLYVMEDKTDYED